MSYMQTLTCFFFQLSTHIRTEGHVRFDKCAITNITIASRLIFIQKVHMAQCAIAASMLSRIFVIRACLRA